jgi:hypothetical protein
MSTNPWVRGPLLGAVLGLPILGGGGRLAMRAIAWQTNVPGAFSLEGTLTVVLSGLASGIAGGVLYALLVWLAPRRRWLRALLFTSALILLMLRGLNPVSTLTFTMFAPLVLSYGALFEWMWHRRRVEQPLLTG